MDAESELIQKRQEVKEEVLALKEQIPSALIFNQLGKVFKRNSLGYWILSILLLNFILLSPWLIIGLVLKEITKNIPVLGYGIIATELVIFGLIAGHVAVQSILDDIANQIIDKIQNINDISKILFWLKQTWAGQYISSVVLLFCILWTLLSIGNASIIVHQFVGFGFSFWCALTGLLAGIVFYIPLWASLLVSNLRTYQYDMNAISPANSEILVEISEMSMKSIYMLAAYTAIVTFLATSSQVDQQLRATFSFPVVVVAWTAIAIQFLLTRSTLGTITNRAKWKTINKLQTKINTIESTGDLSDKDTVERLFRLAEVHKQIMASETNALDLKSFSTLFSQLMLPLLGLLLGNLDKLSKLLP